jgi:hypothetical protein
MAVQASAVVQDTEDRLLPMVPARQGRAGSRVALLLGSVKANPFAAHRCVSTPTVEASPVNQIEFAAPGAIASGP